MYTDTGLNFSANSRKFQSTVSTITKAYNTHFLPYHVFITSQNIKNNI